MNKAYTAAIFVMLALFIVFKVPFSSRTSVKAQTVGEQRTSNPSALLQKLKASQLTIGQLVDSLSSSHADERRDAVAAISILRNHYIDEAARAANPKSLVRPTDGVIMSAYNTLAFLRPSDSAILSSANQNIRFSPRAASITAVSAPPPGVEYPAARVLVRASFPALPILEKSLRTDTVQPNGTLTQQQRLRLQCTVAILGSNAPSWFRELAATEQNPAVQKSLRYCATLVSSHEKIVPGAPPPAPNPASTNGLEIIRNFGAMDALDEELDTSDLDQIDADNYKIRWNAASGLSDDSHFATDRPLPSWPNEKTAQTIISSHDVERTMALLSYTICLRLNTDSHIKSSQKHMLFTDDAIVVAVNSLGILRSMSLAPYEVWLRLRHASVKIHLEDDNSHETDTSIRTLCQIDVPAVKLLTDRIASELSPEQQRAATYTLSRIAGRYSLPYISDAITVRQKWMMQETDQFYKSQYQDEIMNLKNMMALGIEKGWFTGSLSGTSGLVAG